MHRSQGCYLTSSNKRELKPVKIGNPRQCPHARPRQSRGTASRRIPLTRRSNKQNSSPVGEIRMVNQSDFAFTCWQLRRAPFRVLIGREYMFLCEICSSAPFLQACSTSLPILDTNPPPDTRFASIFSQPAACLFIFLMTASGFDFAET